MKCRYFEAEQFEIAGDWISACDGERFRIISVVDGEGKLYYDKGADCMQLKGGDNILLPASLGTYKLSATDKACVLLQAVVP